jgi:FMN phosphatase YigB (HAD superfamily)
MLSEACCGPRELAYVGDRVDNDIVPALAAGLVAVHVRRGPWGRLQQAPPEASVVDSLAELPRALELVPG